MKQRRVADLSALPTWAFGSSSTPWWGTLAFVGIEGTGFGLAIGAYFYLAAVNTSWLGQQAGSPWAGSALTVLLLASVIPNWWAGDVARKQDLRRVRLALLVMSAIGTVGIVIRGFEIASLTVRWDTNSYGSMVWMLVGLHATHLITDVVDTWVLTALMFTRHAQPRRFSDVTDNAFYWYFVVIAWLPLYFLLYWLPVLNG